MSFKAKSARFARSRRRIAQLHEVGGAGPKPPQRLSHALEIRERTGAVPILRAGSCAAAVWGVSPEGALQNLTLIPLTLIPRLLLS